METAEELGGFNGFLHLLEAAGMAEMLEGEGPFTLFAPTDEAFGRLPADILKWLLADEGRKALEAVTQSHIVADAAITTDDLLGLAVEFPTLGGDTLAIDGTSGLILLVPIEAAITEVDGQEVVEQESEAIPVSALVVEARHGFVLGTDRPATGAQQELGVAMVIEPNIKADNGVIHGIDLVLLPPKVLWLF